MILKLGMEHYEPKFFKVNINDDPGLTLTYFTGGQIWSPIWLNGETCHLMGKSCSK